jgi:hypothetical protein
VLLVRDMGAPRSLTLDLPVDRTLPTVIACGRQLAAEGAFFPGCYEPVSSERLVEAALGEVARGATWVKVLTDWADVGLTYPIEALRALVAAVHAVGARVAAHSTWPTVREVVLAGVDSIEHGSSIDPETLALMAERGAAWTPTTGAIEAQLGRLRQELARTDVTVQRRRQLDDWTTGCRPPSSVWRILRR